MSSQETDIKQLFSGPNGKKRTPHSMLKDERGVSLIEAAITVPLLLLLVFGLIDVGRYANFSILVSNAARSGVQYGAQNLGTSYDSAGMQSAALSDGQDGQNIAGLSAVASHSCKCADGSASTCLATDCSLSHRIVWVTVSVSGAFSSLGRYPGIPDPFNVTTTTTRRVAVDF
ncbi:MAG: pilus assembly protein [Candidatus Eremiobacteraeota bacterium]|nr:pilus assembly protein [Candidatus Eremiobacteraeota bacterium]